MLTSKKLPGISGRQVTVRVGEGTRIDPTAQFGSRVTIGDNVVIGRGCSIGAGSRIDDNVTIRARVTLGESVRLFGQCIIKARSSIGARSTINQGFIGERVVIGTSAQCQYVIIENGAAIGDRFVACGSPDSRVAIKPQVIIHDDVSVKGGATIGGYGVGGKTIIGKGTQLKGQLMISDYVTIGEMCSIDASDIDLCGHVGDHVKLYRASVGYRASVDSNSEVYAGVKDGSQVGKRVIVQSNADIPAGWLIPDDVVVNPNPAGINIPVVIPRGPRPRS